MAITYNKDGAYIEVVEDGVTYRRAIKWEDCVVSIPETGIKEKIDMVYINTSDQLVLVLEDESEITLSQASDAVLKSLFDANTIIYATTDNTPVTLTVDEQTVVGRITGGDIAALTVAQLITLALSLALPENVTIILDALLSADEKWSGISEIGTMGYSATVGDLIYLAVGDTKWEKTDATQASTSKGKIGLCLATTSENSTCQVLLYGKMRSAAFPALTVGAPVHISEATAGAIQVAAPTGTTNFVVRIIGYGNTADDLFFCPDNTYIELA